MLFIARGALEAYLAGIGCPTAQHRANGTYVSWQQAVCMFGLEGRQVLIDEAG
jgi:hypothetical protein